MALLGCLEIWMLLRGSTIPHVRKQNNCPVLHGGLKIHKSSALPYHRTLMLSSNFTIKVKAWTEATQRSAFSGQVNEKWSFVCLAHYIMRTLYVLYRTANCFHMKIKAVGRNVFSPDRNENWENLEQVMLRKDITDRHEARTDSFGDFSVERRRRGLDHSYTPTYQSPHEGIGKLLNVANHVCVVIF